MHKGTLMALGALAVLGIPRVAHSQVHRFRIQDYKPARFVDLQWRVSGSAGYSESHSNRSHPFYDYSLLMQNSWREKSKSAFARVDSRTDYTFRTPARNLLTSLSLVGNVNYSSRRDHHGVSSEATAASSDTRGYSRSIRHDIEIEPVFSFENYVTGDLFVSANVDGRFHYYKDGWRAHTSARTLRSSTDSVAYIVDEYSSSLNKYWAQHFLGHVSSSLGFGIGRIWQGDFAATAIYVIDELRKNGLLLNEPTADQMRQLSDIIYHNKLKHAIDTRTRFIESMQDVLGYLGAEALIPADKIMVPLLTQDVWTYFPKTSRAFGWKAFLEGGLGVDGRWTSDSEDRMEEHVILRYHKDSIDNADTLGSQRNTSHGRRCLNTRITSRFLRVQAFYYLPLDLKWQLSTSLSGEYHFSREDGSRLDDNWIRPPNSSPPTLIEEEYSLARLSVTLVNIVNSRTSYALFGDIEYFTGSLTVTRRTIENGEEVDSRHPNPRMNRLNGSLTLTGNYRVSLSTEVQFNLKYRDGRNARAALRSGLIEDDVGDVSIMLGISHYLF